MGDEEAGDAAMLNADNCPCGRGLADTVMNECRQGGSGSVVSCAAPHCRFGAGEGRRGQALPEEQLALSATETL